MHDFHHVFAFLASLTQHPENNIKSVYFTTVQIIIDIYNKVTKA